MLCQLILTMDKTVDLSDSLGKPSNECPYVMESDLTLTDEEALHKFHVMHLNVCSFLKNSDKLKLLLEEMNQNKVVMDVILICESFVTDVNLPFVDIPGYTCISKLRKDRPGGGILIFVRKGLKVLKVLDTPWDETFESLFITVEIFGKVLCVGELYRIPNTNLKQFECNYKKLLNIIACNKNVIIRSDHNLDLLKINKHSVIMKFIEDLSMSGLVPSINKPTRVTHSSSTLIDNIFIGGPTLFNYDSFVLIDDISDHYACILRFEKPCKTFSGDKVITKRKLNDRKYDLLNQRLLFHDWSRLPSDVNEGYSYLVDMINLYLNQVAPAKEILITQGQCFVEPWMNVQLCKLNSKCKRLYKRALEKPECYQHYKQYRATLNRLKLYNKRMFESQEHVCICSVSVNV